MSIKKWHVGGLFAAMAIVSVIVVACQPRQQTPAALTPTPSAIPPYLSILPNEVLPGGVLAVIGSDWLPGEEVTIGLVPTVPSPNVGTAILAIATANVQGRFEFTATLPSSVVPGVWMVYAQTRIAGRFASDSLTVIQPPTPGPATATVTPTLVPTTGPQQPTAAATRQPLPTATHAPPRPIPPPTVLPSFPDWRGDYFANASLSGFPSVIRNDPVLIFDWGYGSPDPRIPPDFFSVRWTRNMFFEAGTYRFIFRVDDGMRMYVDNVLVLDAWADGPPRDVSTDLTLGRGDHAFRIEYYERTGLAMFIFNLFRLPPGTPSPFPSSTPTQPPPPTWTPPPPLPTNTPIPVPTMIPPLPTNTPAVIPTAIPLPTSAPLPTATHTPVPATATPTSTSTSTPTSTSTAIPASTPTATATNAPAAATATPTSTSIPASTPTPTTPAATPAATPASTPTPTSTPTTAPATATPTPTSTPTTAPATATHTPTSTPTTEPATATPAPTEEPTATHTPTTEPAATETPTSEPTATATEPSTEPTATHTPTSEPETATPTPTTPAATATATTTPTTQITVNAVITGGVYLRVTGTGFTAGEKLIISLAENPDGSNAVALNADAPYTVPRNGRLNFRIVLPQPPAGKVYAVVTDANGEVRKIVPVTIRP